MNLAKVIAMIGLMLASCGGDTHTVAGANTPEAAELDAGLPSPAATLFVGHLYCGRAGYECKKEGWPEPDLTNVVKQGSTEREFHGVAQVLHQYQFGDGSSVLSYAVKGGLLHSWVIGIGESGMYAILDYDCDGVFEVKSAKGDTYTPTCAAKPSPNL